MSKEEMPEVITVYVYQDVMPHFEERGPVTRVTDHQPESFEHGVFPQPSRWVQEKALLALQAERDRLKQHCDDFIFGEGDPQEYATELARVQAQRDQLQAENEALKAERDSMRFLLGRMGDMEHEDLGQFKDIWDEVYNLLESSDG